VSSTPGTVERNAPAKIPAKFGAGVTFATVDPSGAADHDDAAAVTVGVQVQADVRARLDGASLAALGME
jgi:hypothetical protein